LKEDTDKEQTQQRAIGIAGEFENSIDNAFVVKGIEKDNYSG